MIRQFSVSEARTAIACPRIFYFDERRFRDGNPQRKRVTQIWTDAAVTGSAASVTGCGKLFHDTIERFNTLALDAPEVREALEKAAMDRDANVRALHIFEQFKRFINERCLNRAILNSKDPPNQNAFIKAIDQYVDELAKVLSYAVGHGRPPRDLISEFFGDTRKQVDVTFNVGANNEPIRIRGILDYIYFDYRQASNRILDFKLTPAEAISKDLLQTSLYALMHHQQHGTQPDAAVMYLHPERQVVEHRWAQVYTDRHKVFDLLASMDAWSDYRESSGTGLKPPGEPALCKSCPWNRNGQCERRLGSKTSGERLQLWTLAALQPGAIEPQIAKHEPPDPAPAEEYDDVLESEPNAELEPPTLEPASQIDSAGLQLGVTIQGNQPVAMPVASLATHVSILGAAGSGKSWLAKVVAEEAIRHGVPVLAIDPQGDLVQFLRPANLPPEASNEERAAQAAFRERMEVRIWTPGTSHAQRLSLSPLRLPKLSELQGIESPQRRQEEWDAMLGVAAGNLVQLAQVGGDLDVLKTFVLEILRKLTAKSADDCVLSINDIVAALAAPEALGIDDADLMISKANREKLIRKLFTRMRGPSSSLFTGGVSLDMERMIRPLDANKTPLNVVYLNAMADDAQKHYFVAALAAEVYRWMITSASTGKVRLLVYLDEARDFLPAGMSKPPAKEPLLRLFAQARKFGVSCLICTQSPRSVDYQIFSNASTKLIGRLEAAQDVQRVADWFKDGDGAPAWLPGRNGASKGNFVGRWPDIPAALEGAEFRSRRLYSLHEGAWSPERVEMEWHQSPHAKILSP